MHRHVPCFFQQRLRYQKNLEFVPSLAFQREWEAACLSSSGSREVERLLLLSTAPASVRPHLHTRGFTRTTLKKYLVHKECNFTRKQPSIAVILAGNSFADLPYFVSGLSCTDKKTLLVRSKFMRVALCQCSHICETFFSRDKGWGCQHLEKREISGFRFQVKEVHSTHWSQNCQWTKM